MDQGIGIAGEGDVSDSAAGLSAEKQEIARLDRLGRNGDAMHDLLSRIPGEDHARGPRTSSGPARSSRRPRVSPRPTDTDYR